MDQDLFKSVVAPVTVSLGTAIVTAAVGGMAIWMKDWVNDRDREYRRSKILDRSMKTISFFDQWLESHAAVSTPEEHAQAKREAQRHLAKIYAAVEHAYLRNDAEWPSGEIEDDDSPLDDWLKQGLLLYRPTTRVGWIARSIFYSYLVLFILTVVGLAMRWQMNLNYFLLAFGTFLFFLIPALFIRWWAVTDEARAAVKSGKGPTTRFVQAMGYAREVMDTETRTAT